MYTELRQCYTQENDVFQIEFQHLMKHGFMFLSRNRHLVEAYEFACQEKFQNPTFTGMLKFARFFEQF